MAKRQPANLHQIGDLRLEIETQFPHFETWGDCALWAIQLATTEAEININYPRIADDLVQLKQANREEYPRSSDRWFETHCSVPPELTRTLLTKYFDEEFVLLRPIRGKYTLGRLTKNLQEISVALIGTPEHITFTSRGEIYDDGNPSRRYVTDVIVPQSDALKALSIVRRLDAEYDHHPIEIDRDLSVTEDRNRQAIQDRMRIDYVYCQALWVLTGSRGLTSMDEWFNLTNQELLDVQDLDSMKFDRQILGEIIEDLVDRDIIRILKGSREKRTRTMVLSTGSTLEILGRLSFDLQ